MASIEPARSVAHFFEQSWDVDHTENGEGVEQGADSTESSEPAEQSDPVETPVTLTVAPSVTRASHVA
jgi:hypothetical protein